MKRSKGHINDLVLEEITSANKIVDEEVKKSQLLAENPDQILNAKMQIKNHQKFIDIIGIDDQENTFKTSLDIETSCERIITENDGFMLKNILMPKFVEKHEEAFTFHPPQQHMFPKSRNRDNQVFILFWLNISIGKGKMFSCLYSAT